MNYDDAFWNSLGSFEPPMEDDEPQQAPAKKRKVSGNVVAMNPSATIETSSLLMHGIESAGVKCGNMIDISAVMPQIFEFATNVTGEDGKYISALALQIVIANMDAALKGDDDFNFGSMADGTPYSANGFKVSPLDSGVPAGALDHTVMEVVMQIAAQSADYKISRDAAWGGFQRFCLNNKAKILDPYKKRVMDLTQDYTPIVDDTEQIDRILFDYMKVDDRTSASKAYYRAALRHMFDSTARMLNTYENDDYQRDSSIYILVGGQGVGKGAMLKALALSNEQAFLTSKGRRDLKQLNKELYEDLAKTPFTLFDEIPGGIDWNIIKNLSGANQNNVRNSYGATSRSFRSLSAIFLTTNEEKIVPYNQTKGRREVIFRMGYEYPANNNGNYFIPIAKEYLATRDEHGNQLLTVLFAQLMRNALYRYELNPSEFTDFRSVLDKAGDGAVDYWNDLKGAAADNNATEDLDSMLGAIVPANLFTKDMRNNDVDSAVAWFTGRAFRQITDKAATVNIGCTREAFYDDPESHNAVTIEELGFIPQRALASLYNKVNDDKKRATWVAKILKSAGWSEVDSDVRARVRGKKQKDWIKGE